METNAGEMLRLQVQLRRRYETPRPQVAQQLAIAPGLQKTGLGQQAAAHRIGPNTAGWLEFIGIAYDLIGQGRQLRVCRQRVDIGRCRYSLARLRRHPRVEIGPPAFEDRTLPGQVGPAIMLRICQPLLQFAFADAGTRRLSRLWLGLCGLPAFQAVGHEIGIHLVDTAEIHAADLNGLGHCIGIAGIVGARRWVENAKDEHQHGYACPAIGLPFIHYHTSSVLCVSVEPTSILQRIGALRQYALGILECTNQHRCRVINKCPATCFIDERSCIPARPELILIIWLA